MNFLCLILKHKYPKPKNLSEALSDKTCLRCGHIAHIKVYSLIPFNVLDIELSKSQKSSTERFSKECREHHFSFGGRCMFCSMQQRYYDECLATLNSWSEKNKRNPKEHWEEKVKDIKECKLHFHGDT